jgi:hypothetical protein
MHRVVALSATLLAFTPAALAQDTTTQDKTNWTGQPLDQRGPKGDTSPSVGSKEVGGAGNAAGQDGLPSRTPSAQDRSMDKPDLGSAKPTAKD